MKPQRSTACRPSIRTPEPTKTHKTDYLVLKFKGQDNFEVFYKVKRGTELKKVMTSYCDKRSVKFRTTTFLFDGKLIRGGQTPDELEMEDGDEIDAMLPQSGGGGLVCI